MHRDIARIYMRGMIIHTQQLMSTYNPSKTAKQEKRFQKTKIQDDAPTNYWQRFKAGNIIWLENFYSKQKHKIDRQTIEKTLNKHKQSLQNIKNLIQKRQKQANKHGEYMQKFKECRSQSYMSFKIEYNNYASSILSSYELMTEQGYGPLEMGNPSFSTQEAAILHEFRIDRYKNYMKLTNLLSNQKYTYKYIAKHYFIDKTETSSRNQFSDIHKSYFIYQVQKGIQFQGKGVSQYLNPMVIYLMARDVAKGIQELEKRGIYHADLKPANTICVRQKPQDLLDKSKSKDIAFKIIDFDRAYLVVRRSGPKEKQLYQEENKLHQYAERIFTKLDDYTTLAKSYMFNSQHVKCYRDLLVNDKKEGPNGYQLDHAQQLLQLIMKLERKIDGSQAMNTYNWLNKRDEIYKLAQSGDYKGLIETLDSIIDEQFNKPLK